MMKIDYDIVEVKQVLSFNHCILTLRSSSVAEHYLFIDADRRNLDYLYLLDGLNDNDSDFIYCDNGGRSPSAGCYTGCGNPLASIYNGINSIAGQMRFNKLKILFKPNRKMKEEINRALKKAGRTTSRLYRVPALGNVAYFIRDLYERYTAFWTFFGVVISIVFSLIAMVA